MSNTPYVLIATNSTSQAITDNSATDLVCDTLDSNSINVGTRSSTSSILIPVKGLYLVTATMGISTTAAGPYRLFAFRNSELPAYGENGLKAVASQKIDISISTQIYFQAGDTLHIQVYQNTTGTVSIGDTTENRSKICVTKLSD